ncbi:unnamed protein product [Strongylus vulgaris]|uniref:Uncharacterized protein n=1 Tax=Strongylus vulgaris TaxID=40348 RepID=A0A3P7IN73_STRVU|nr:unnamed protein product [Strongylus vulgaris]
MNDSPERWWFAGGQFLVTKLSSDFGFGDGLSAGLLLATGENRSDCKLLTLTLVVVSDFNGLSDRWESGGEIWERYADE